MDKVQAQLAALRQVALLGVLPFLRRGVWPGVGPCKHARQNLCARKMARARPGVNRTRN